MFVFLLACLFVCSFVCLFVCSSYYYYFHVIFVCVCVCVCVCICTYLSSYVLVFCTIILLWFNIFLETDTSIYYSVLLIYYALLFFNLLVHKCLLIYIFLHFVVLIICNICLLFALYLFIYSNKLFFHTFKTKNDQFCNCKFLFYCTEYLYKRWKIYKLLSVMLYLYC